MEQPDASAGPQRSPPGPPLPPIERQLQELQALYELAQALYAINDLDRLLQLAVERAMALLEVESLAVILLDTEAQELYFKVADHRRSGVKQRLREVRFFAHQGIAGWVVQRGIFALVPDVSQDPRWYPGVDVQTGMQTKSLLSVPLRTAERILGVVSAVNKRQRPFDSEDVRLLEAFAGPLALAVENAQLIQALQSARERVQEENLYLREAVGQRERFEIPEGASPRMQEISRLVAQVLNLPVTILLTGESGTGKEVLAQAIHAQGPRAQGPFIAVNCAAIPETLLEAELFGYERGAFTGAIRRKPGRFELAAGGTLLLDEIGEMSLALQVKLLRVLQEKRVERLGGTVSLALDAQIIAATNQNLERLVAQGRFRADLFYRLNIYPIPLPPLRERKEDVLPLAQHFLLKYSRELRKEGVGLSDKVQELLLCYEWPGNIRELENAIHRAVIVSQGALITLQDLPLELREWPRGTPVSGDGFRLPPEGLDLPALEKQLIRQALEQAHHNKSQASRLLHLSRMQLRTRVKNYGLETRRESGTPPSGDLP
jgi:Nif-specific regulatory protein